MIKILLVLLLLYATWGAFNRPIVPIFGYYLNAILQPEDIWFWAFEGFPFSFVLTCLTLAACVITFFKEPEKIFNRVREKQTLALLVMWLLIELANLLASYPSAQAGVPVSLVMETLRTLIIVYFASSLTLSTEKDLKTLSHALLFGGGYLCYWANHAYLSGEMWNYTTNGRLSGPGTTYLDENGFALVFVITAPLLYFFALSQKSKLKRWGFLACLPLLWHAIFLTGSRGGLTSTVVATAACILFTKARSIKILAILSLTLAILYQGGELLSRTQTTVQSANQDNNEPIDPRIKSWSAGIQMIRDHPIFGVGTERFIVAYGFYKDGIRHVAHNTFLQLAANNGLPTGIIYCLFFWWAWRSHSRFHKKLEPSSELAHINNATFCALIGFFICSMFLDLMISELLYYLLLLNLIKNRACSTSIKENLF